MIKRCYNPTTAHFQNYGGKGIRVCDRWRNSFETFLADMGERPREHNLDRIDSTKDYEPNNCQWLERRENSRRNSEAKYFTVLGQTLTIGQWAQQIGVHPTTITYRLKTGMDIGTALSLGALSRRDSRRAFATWRAYHAK